MSFDVRPADKNGAQPGDIVWIEATGGALARRARVLERIGPMSDPRTVSLISIAANDIPVEFPEAAVEEAERAKAAPLGDRLDLRQTPLVTIDGEDARDFDDAVFAEPDPDHPGGWRLLVAIADVAWYVRHDKPLDRAAYRRGTSVYFPDRVVPMLARSALQPLVLAGAARGSSGAGGRDADRRAGPPQEPPLPSRHDAIGRTPHLHPRAARHGRHAGRGDRAADGSRGPPALRRLPGAAGGARDPRRARPRPAGATGHPGRRRAHRRDRRARTPRQPQADRGVHGSGQRGGGPGAGAAQGRLPLPRPRPARPRPSSRRCASSWARWASRCRPGSGCARPTSTACCTRWPTSRSRSWSARRCCAARARPSTVPTISAISASRWRATPISPPQSAAIPTSSSIAP